MDNTDLIAEVNRKFDF